MPVSQLNMLNILNMLHAVSRCIDPTSCHSRLVPRHHPQIEDRTHKRWVGRHSSAWCQGHNLAPRKRIQWQVGGTSRSSTPIYQASNQFRQKWYQLSCEAKGKKPPVLCWLKFTKGNSADYVPTFEVDDKVKSCNIYIYMSNLGCCSLVYFHTGCFGLKLIVGWKQILYSIEKPLWNDESCKWTLSFTKYSGFSELLIKSTLLWSWTGPWAFVWRDLYTCMQCIRDIVTS